MCSGGHHRSTSAQSLVLTVTVPEGEGTAAGGKQTNIIAIDIGSILLLQNLTG